MAIVGALDIPFIHLSVIWFRSLHPQPVVAKPEASESALSRLVDTFFGGSAGAAVVNLLGKSGERLSSEEIAEIEAELARIKRGSGG